MKIAKNIMKMSVKIFKYSKNSIILYLLILIINYCDLVISQDANIVLKQGTVVGLKVFPESSRVPVYAYLGIPYAEPPVGNLRFTRPVANRGWNRTLYARDFQPICPQIDNNIYEEGNLNYYHAIRSSEDCLYLNIWTPETGLRYGNLPVVAIITGEEMAFDWLQNRPSGLDLASEGIIVVTIQYRTNIFGWLTLENEMAPGNLGLHDQHLALQWINENIGKFGGDNTKITLLGHGTSGATTAMLHLISPRSRGLFNKMILMSGTIFSSYSFQQKQKQQQQLIRLHPHTRRNRLRRGRISSGTLTASEQIVKILACEALGTKYTLNCLQQKSISDLLKAFESVYKNGNYTILLGAVIDDYLNETIRYIPEDPRKIISLGNVDNIPIMMGLCSNEGAFIHEHWIDLAKQGYGQLKSYINTTIISNIIEHYSFSDTSGQSLTIRDTIKWRFIDQFAKTTMNLLNSLQRLISETKYELPFFETIEFLSSDNLKMGEIINGSEIESDEYFEVNSLTNKTRILIDGKQHLVGSEHSAIKRGELFVYLFDYKNGIDMRGRVNLFGGSSHSADLPFLLGPSLFQQISRRRLTQIEDKLCRRMRQLFGDFIKTGHPTPGRLFDAWQPYTNRQKYIKALGGGRHESSINLDKQQNTNQFGLSSDFEENMEQIESMLKDDKNQMKSYTRSETATFNPYNLDPEQVLTNNEGHSDRLGKKAFNYLETTKRSSYYIHLKNVYSFWYDLLPKIYRHNNELDRIDGIRANSDNQNINYYDEINNINNNNSSKYKHAFFSMLMLVCLLLAILCICVYILKRNHRIDSSVL